MNTFDIAEYLYKKAWKRNGMQEHDELTFHVILEHSRFYIDYSAQVGIKHLFAINNKIETALVECLIGRDFDLIDIRSWESKVIEIQKSLDKIKISQQ